MFLFILFLAGLGLGFCRDFSLVVVLELLIAVASLVAEHGLWSAGSVVMAHRHFYSTACGIFLDQGSNPCLPYWEADSLPLSH